MLFSVYPLSTGLSIGDRKGSLSRATCLSLWERCPVRALGGEGGMRNTLSVKNQRFLPALPKGEPRARKNKRSFIFPTIPQLFFSRNALRQKVVENSTGVCYNAFTRCGYSSSVECELPKLERWVRFPLPAPKDHTAQQGGVILYIKKRESNRCKCNAGERCRRGLDRAAP